MTWKSALQKIIGERSEWKIMEQYAIQRSSDNKLIGVLYVLQDQHGDIKFKRVFWR